jgi:hypothetical protein
MKKYLPALIVLLSLTIYSSATATPPETPASQAQSCEDEIDGTCRHFDYGDGSEDPSFTVLFMHAEYESCTIESTTGSVCDFDIDFCPNPPTPGVRGQDEPGVVDCNDCGGQSFGSYSIAEAKCCLIYGQPTNPAHGSPRC